MTGWHQVHKYMIKLPMLKCSCLYEVPPFDIILRSMTALSFKAASFYTVKVIAPFNIEHMNVSLSDQGVVVLQLLGLT